MKIIVTGGTGFIGKPLVQRLLKDGHRVVVLTRNSLPLKNFLDSNLKTELWDGKNSGPWAEQLCDADAVINLAGAGIADKRWTLQRKTVIKLSRLDATKALVHAMTRHIRRPKVFVSGSAVGFYGVAPEGEVNESSPMGKDFLAGVCGDWEAEAKKAEEIGVRVVLARFGIVIEKNGGALKKMILPFFFFLGGPLGHGRQPFPWVHRDDVIDAILFSIQNQAVAGPVNVVAPEMITTRQFCQALADAMRRPCWLPVPGFMLKILLGGMSELLLKGQKVSPAKLIECGYHFRHTKAKDTLRQLFTVSS